MGAIVSSGQHLLASMRRDDFELKPINMSEVVEQVRERLAYMIEQHQATLHITTEWPSALGHAPWVEEVWANYVSNGVKYGGDPPHLELGATAVENDQVRFWVRDNGRGLNTDEQGKLFKQFSRLDGNKTAGHGLGLSIVKQIVEQLGGSAGVESAPGRGSEFY